MLINPFKETKITVIDSVMGSGKSTWAINYVNKNPDKKFILILPTIDEAKRFQRAIDRKVIRPDKKEHKGQNLQDVLYDAVLDGKTIASTHAMLENLTEKTLELISNQGYTLVLDEVLNLVEPYTGIDELDYQKILKAGMVKEAPVRDNIIRILPEDNDDYFKEGVKLKFTPFMNLVRREIMYKINGRFFVTEGTPDKFHAFDEIYVMTYLYSESLFNGWLIHNSIQYETKTIIDGELGEFKDEGGIRYKDLIHIVEDQDLNSVGSSTLSASFYKKKATARQLVNIQDSVVKFCKRYDATADNLMWSCFKDNMEDLAPPRFTTLGKGIKFSEKKYAESSPEDRVKNYTYVVSNIKGTNLYRNKTHVAILVDYFSFPQLKHFFTDFGIPFDEEKYALSEMLQVIFRSAVRDGKEIYVFVPSKRMRNLLKKWLEGPYKSLPKAQS